MVRRIYYFWCSGREVNPGAVAEDQPGGCSQIFVFPERNARTRKRPRRLSVKGVGKEAVISRFYFACPYA